MSGQFWKAASAKYASICRKSDAMSAKLRAIRAAVFAVCVVLFTWQASREVHKYFTHLTSTSISTYEEHELRFPIIVICHKLPFKTDEAITTKEEYERFVYQFDDLFNASKFNPPLGDANVHVKKLDSLWYGRCYAFEYENLALKDWVTIGIHNMDEVNIALFEKGQEICIELGICPDPYPLIEPESTIMEFWLTAKKKIRTKSVCNASDDFDYYSCLENAIVGKIANLTPCALPFQNFIFNGSFTSRTKLEPCHDRESLNASIMSTMNWNNALIRNPEDFGCQRACQRWIYPYQYRNYDNQAIVNVMGGKFELWQSTMWLTFLSRTVEVVEEYAVNDLTAFLASIGGSLGLFLGFSCFDCLIMAINAMHDRNRGQNMMRENVFGSGGQESIVSTRTEKSTV